MLRFGEGLEECEGIGVVEEDRGCMEDIDYGEECEHEEETAKLMGGMVQGSGKEIEVGIPGLVSVQMSIKPGKPVVGGT